MADPARPRLQRLWPTLFKSLSLPSAAQGNAAVTPILPKADPGSDNLTVQYLDQDIFAIPHPAIHWLRQCCDKAICDYAAEAGLSCRPDFELQGWVNIDRPGDYHNLHNHPHSWLSDT